MVRLPTRPLVLVVDDDEDTREMFVVSLTNMGFAAVGMDDGGQAYGRARHLRPDLIMTDLTLTDGEAWDFLRCLRADPMTKAIPIVVVSGHVGPAWRARAAAEGCASFVAKPCAPRDLAAELRRVLERWPKGSVSPGIGPRPGGKLHETVRFR
jgi:CheY-like chemotaxis protein